MRRPIPLLIALWLPLPLLAQPAGGQAIYTCVDSQGRRLTSDRPILECLDREQREMGRSGVTRRVIPPAPSPAEQARLERERKTAEQAKARQNEESQRDRALVLRYPDKAAHDRSRDEALAQVDKVIAALREREQTLQRRLREADAALQTHAQQRTQAPAPLLRQQQDATLELAQQQRLVQQQLAERERVDSRFDSELQRLERLWGGKAP